MFKMPDNRIAANKAFGALIKTYFWMKIMKMNKCAKQLLNLKSLLSTNMRKFYLPLILIALFVSGTASAQIITKYGDNVSTLDGIIKAYYDVVSVPKGGKVYYERDSLLHWPGAMVGLSAVTTNGKIKIRNMTLKEFHRLSDSESEKDGFDEREISRKVEKFGNLYHVWSTYESRNSHDGPVIDRGIDS